MATSLSTKQTRLEQLETDLYNLRVAHDFQSESPGGGRTEVRDLARMRAQLMAEIRTLKREIWAEGGMTVSEPARPGVDISRSSTNGDDYP